MSEMSLKETESPTPPNSDTTEAGTMKVEEVTATARVMAPAPSANVAPLSAATQQRLNRAATVEHLAARRAFSELSASEPGVKEKLSELRTELTFLVTDLR